MESSSLTVLLEVGKRSLDDLSANSVQVLGALALHFLMMGVDDFLTFQPFDDASLFWGSAFAT